MSFVGRKSEPIRQALAVALDGLAIDGRRAVGLVADAGPAEPFETFAGCDCC